MHEQEMKKLSGLGSASEVNLVVFVLDGSPSMEEKSTPDRRTKAEHLVEIVKATLERLHGSSAKSSFRVTLLYFDSEIDIEKEGERTFLTLDEALKKLENPVEHMGRINSAGGTAIADALEHTRTVAIKSFKDADGLPESRYFTVFLFTDGEENIRSKEDVKGEAAKLKMDGAKLATISFGSDADSELLSGIASELFEQQKTQLEYAKVISHLPNPAKMYVEGHAGGALTEEKAQAIRQFLDVLSRTYKNVNVQE